MKKLFLIFGLCAVVAACEKQDDNRVARSCGEYNVEMTFSQDGETMSAVINGDNLEMERAISASGARYVGILNDTTVTLWGKGEDWTMFLNDEEPIFCE